MGLGFASFIGVPARQFALGSHRKNFPAVLDQVFLNTVRADYVCRVLLRGDAGDSTGRAGAGAGRGGAGV